MRRWTVTRRLSACTHPHALGRVDILTAVGKGRARVIRFSIVLTGQVLYPRRCVHHEESVSTHNRQIPEKSLALIGNASGQDSEGAEHAPRHFR
jgi:hypothetical protein